MEKAADNKFYIFKEDYIFNSRAMLQQQYLEVKKMEEHSGSIRE